MMPLQVATTDSELRPGPQDVAGDGASVVERGKPRAGREPQRPDGFEGVMALATAREAAPAMPATPAGQAVASGETGEETNVPDDAPPSMAGTPEAPVAALWVAASMPSPSHPAAQDLAGGVGYTTAEATSPLTLDQATEPAAQAGAENLAPAAGVSPEGLRLGMAVARRTVDGLSDPPVVAIDVGEPTQRKATPPLLVGPTIASQAEATLGSSAVSEQVPETPAVRPGPAGTTAGPAQAGGVVSADQPRTVDAGQLPRSTEPLKVAAGPQSQDHETSGEVHPVETVPGQAAGDDAETQLLQAVTQGSEAEDANGARPSPDASQWGRAAGSSGASPVGAASTLPGLAHLGRDQTAQHVLEQVVRQARLLSYPGRTELMVRLEPDGLGHLLVRLVLHGDQIQINITAENSSVQQALAGNLNQLRDSLERQGIPFDLLEVASGQQDFTDKYHDAPDGEAPSEGPGRHPSPSPDAPTASSTGATRLAAGGHLIDYRV